jgi:cytochrome P450
MVARSVVATSAVATSVLAARLARRADPKALVRWGTRDGLPYVLMRSAARRGDPFGRMIADAALRADPYRFYDELRAAGPLLPSKVIYVTARHDVVAEISRSEEFRCGFPEELQPRAVQALMRWALDPSALGPVERPSMLVENGDDHARHRRSAARAFTARAMTALHHRVEEIAAGLLDRLEAEHRDGPADVVTDYASLLPLLVIAEILGVPATMRESFLRWGRDIAPSIDFGGDYATFRRVEAAVRELNAWLLGHFEHLRREPGDDLLSRIIVGAAEETDAGGRGLDDTELTSIAGLLLVAGFETTVNLLGNGTVLLLGHPDGLEGLRAEPAGWRNAVEEILRFESPVQNTIRYAVRDTSVQGVDVPRGMFIAPLLGAANRDPAVFTDPGTFDVTRANARDHLAFSLGAHFCLGAALARMEGEIGLRALFDRFPDLSLAGAPMRKPTQNLRGYDSVPVRLNALAVV